MSTIRVKELARILKGENTSDDIQFYHDIEDNYDDTDEEYDEDANEELKDLVVIDEDELELEQ